MGVKRFCAFFLLWQNEARNGRYSGVRVKGKRPLTDQPGSHRRDMHAQLRYCLPKQLRLTVRRLHVRPSVHVLVVSIPQQRMFWLKQATYPYYTLHKCFVVSTSRFGTGQLQNSNQTPLGLHQVASKIGAGLSVGTVFESRKPVGLTWQGRPDAAIAHRILWLNGLEPEFNQGGNSDSYRRYIYIHGVGDEPTLGRPASCGCIHLASSDLIPLFDCLPLKTMVWMTEAPVIPSLPFRSEQTRQSPTVDSAAVRSSAVRGHERPRTSPLFT
jgi:hypothetical protein